jgi:hypothetical protein
MKPFLVAIFSLFAAVAILTQAFPDLWNEVEDHRAVAVADTGSGCTTGAAETECSFSLSEESAYATTFGITVTETSPGSADWTDSTTLALDRTTVTISGLAGSTAYLFDVDYKGVNPDLSDDANNLLERFALVMVGGIVLVGAALLLKTYGT